METSGIGVLCGNGVEFDEYGVEAVAKSTEGLEAGGVDGNVAVSLLVFAVLVFVPFICSGAVNGDGLNAHAVWVAAGDVNEVVGDVFAAEGDDIKSEVRFPRFGEAFNNLFDVGEESCFLADGRHYISNGVVDVIGACASAACDCVKESCADDLPAGVAIGEFAA